MATLIAARPMRLPVGVVDELRRMVATAAELEAEGKTHAADVTRAGLASYLAVVLDQADDHR